MIYGKCLNSGILESLGLGLGVYARVQELYQFID